MLTLKTNINWRVDDSDGRHYLLALGVMATPRIAKVEHWVSIDIKPLDVWCISVLTGQDSVSGLGLWVIIHNKFVIFHASFDVKFHGQIRNDQVFFRDLEIVDHPPWGDWDVKLSQKFAVFVDDAQVDFRDARSVAKDEKFTGSSVYPGVSWALMVELFIEIIVAKTYHI